VVAQEDDMRMGWCALAFAGCEVTFDDGSKSTDTAGGTPFTTDPGTTAPGDDDDDDDGGSTGSDGLARCAGPHSGSYAGDQEGVARADLYDDGVIEMVFVNFVELEASGTVTPGGEVDGVGYGIRVEGTYDFDGCSAEGTWSEIGGDDTGTWVLTRD
jgi:hypothetical protein